MARTLSFVRVSQAIDKGLGDAVETLSSVANEEFIDHTAHETVTTATRIQPQ